MLSNGTVERFDGSVVGNSMDLGSSTSTRNCTTSHRSSNVWPAPISGDRSLSGGFGGSGSSGFGSGFGASHGVERAFGRSDGSSGFGSGFGDGFGTTSRRNPSWQTSPTIAHSVASEADKDRRFMTTESLDDMQHGGFLGISSRMLSGRRSSSKRSKTGRRKSSRRGGSERPGHCFNCQEHGHISKMCPRKLTSPSTYEFRVSEIGGGDNSYAGSGLGWHSTPDRMMNTKSALESQQVVESELSKKSGDCSSNKDYEKLEAQKARLSYYGCSLSTHSESSKSPEVDKFSEQLDNALKLSPAGIEKPLRVLETPIRAQTPSIGRGGAFPSAAKAPAPMFSSVKTPELQTIRDTEGKRNTVASLDLMTIETRRTVKRDGEPCFEEWTVVSFPRDLPTNVRVITAQFVPASSQKP